jgi:phosphoribosyl-ATP pyrophosphohydrolase
MENDVLKKLARTLELRKQADPETSYVASLYAGGINTILKKINEEATEAVIAAKSGDKNAIIHETADLWFHTLVMLAQCNLGPDDILNELEKRFRQSGLEEKANRRKSS